MQVIATRQGFYKTRRYPGDVFDVPEGMSGKWFEAHGGAKEPKGDKAKPEKKAKADEGPQTFSDLAKQDAKDQEPKGDKVN